MSWIKGFNFRGTSGYVSDGADQTYVLKTDEYPITRNSVTFGWVFDGGVVQGGNDRDSGIDVRLAGINSTFHGEPYFRVDLPEAGDYEIRIALGDASFPVDDNGCQVKDSTTVVATIGPLTVATDEFIDATSVIRTTANWAANNVAITETFATTQLRLQLGGGAVNFQIAHLSVSQVVTGSDPSFRIQTFRPRIFAPGLAR